jgi:tRNA(Met) cytidine acetyltransferase
MRLQARRWLEGSEHTLWVGEPGEGRVSPRDVRALLGQARDAVVLELYGGLRLEVLAQSEGLVRGGGRLILLEPDEPVADEALVVEPFGIEDVGTRSWERVRVQLPANPGHTRLATSRLDRGTDEQAALVDHLVSRWAGAPSRTAIIADRGRGKSSALGLAIRGLGAQVTVSGPSLEAVREVLRFGGEQARFVPLDAVVDPTGASHVVIDEAAQIDVPTLRRIALAHPRAHLTWASTARGYEGTGAGWVQRFLHWARSLGPLEMQTLTTPIRWGPGDALERWVREALLFDAMPASLTAEGPVSVRHVAQRDLDSSLLAEVYGLLMHAHHRTTPDDLARLLDAPNLDLHVALEGGALEGEHVVGVNLVAREGGLSRERSRSLARHRIRGHVLPDTLVSHAGHLDSGTLRMIRSVRIATHPERRHRGIARMLTEHVHGHYAPDLFGTAFGATSALVAFRHALGYHVARLGSAAGARSGEPSVVMLRPVSAEGHALADALRVDLARNLPRQLQLLAADGVPLGPSLAGALSSALPDARVLDLDEERARVAHYVASGQTFEAAVSVLHTFALRTADHLDALDPIDALLIRARAIELTSWTEAARRIASSVPQAQRRMREAIRALARSDAHPT